MLYRLKSLLTEYQKYILFKNLFYEKKAPTNLKE